MQQSESDLMSLSATSGLLLYTGVFVVASMEVVPDWGMLQLAWPTWVWVAIMGVVGLVAGALLLEQRRLIGALGGIIAGLCAMLFVAGMMQKATQIRTATLVMAGVIGSLPGIGLAAVMNWIANHLSRRASSDESASQNDGTV